MRRPHVRPPAYDYFLQSESINQRENIMVNRPKSSLRPTTQAEIPVRRPRERMNYSGTAVCVRRGLDEM